MIAHGFVDRATKDVDLFTEIDDQEAIRGVVALRQALEAQRLTTRDTERPPLDHRFVAVDPASGAECTVEIFADGGRLRGLVTLDIGPVLHPDDLAADKVLALWDRARPRDYFDVNALLGHYGPDRLLELAAAKDSGFSAATFVDSLRAIARLGEADWAEDGVPIEDVHHLRATFDAWRRRLGESG
ncbi:nucleotidyl transferase AbiEii/AbiGii toxin family protein [Actinocrispum wychmicini]|uniref:Nucleotidyltransferase AbiEii toxin of type IV toxin-antitoxin system n=1 Tax=Actinocrispum wychmicini TaxID=1213861 RepID=A0A4R2JF56_9PSEU|nr:nucleotidyl transferase AbiEii/AbiGii toxin family protein [Actinocrispum wychmicini]TCO52865.1 nucleotidyltransferase AbiEii toxin of type IV toxin-antitoxin system [Actinocrispum wychmicini]